MRALIIGGGIGGLAAAIALRRSGIAAHVFERAPELREVGAGITLWTNAVRVLKKLGVWSALEPASTELTRGEMRNWHGKLLSVDDMSLTSHKYGAPTVGIHRADLQLGLAAALPAADVHLGKQCTGFAAEGEQVRARFADGSEEAGDVLIGADGLNSVVRAQLLGNETPRYAGYIAWRGVGHVEHPAVPLKLTMLCAGRGSQFGMLPIGKGRTYWFASINTPPGGSDPPGGHKAALLKTFRDWYEPVPAVIQATEEGAIVRNDIYDRPPVRKWGEGRMTLVGDAAHPTTPNMGQGACMAIEDALVLARCLKDASDIADGLRKYEAQRYDRTAFITEQSWKLGRMLAWENGLKCAFRDWVVRMFPGYGRRLIEKVVSVEI